MSILKETVCLKSKITWLEAGDKNTKCFHKLVEHQCNINSIWELKNDEVFLISKQGGLQMDFPHFESLFKDGGNISVREQINVIKNILDSSLRMREMRYSFLYRWIN